MKRIWRATIALVALILLQQGIYFLGSLTSFSGIDSRGIYLLQLVQQSPGLQKDLLHFAFSLIGILALVAGLTLLFYSSIKRLLNADRRLCVSLAALWHAIATLLILLLNAKLAPRSIFADEWMVAVTQSVSIYLWAALLGCLFAHPIIFGLIKLWESRQQFMTRIIMGGVIAFVVAVFFSARSMEFPVQAAIASPAKPNIILIGIDSLSQHQLKRYSQASSLYEMYSQGLEFNDVVTPLGRTFPSWVSIFTAKNPANNGARFNLTPFSLLPQQNYLPKILQNAGYQTIYGMDERQFSNVDEYFGFDKIVGPSVGAADFVLSKVSDLPVVNVASKIPYLGKKLFPFVYANRARRNNYDPMDFDREIVNVLDARSDKPLFLSVHFCLPHVPFEWVGAGEKFRSVDVEAQHQKAVGRVSDQVDAFMKALKERGLLNNTLVVFLSDHGEGVESKSAMIATLDKGVGPDLQHSNAERAVVEGRRIGHGTNLLDRDSTDPLLFMQHYKNGENVTPAVKISLPVSVIDIAPTVLDFAGLDVRELGSVDGVSLIKMLNAEDESLAATLSKRARFMETDLYFSAMGDTVHVDEASLLDQAAKYYEVSPSGRLQLKVSTYSELVSLKNRAAIVGNWQMTLIPYGEGESVTVLSDRRTQSWTLDLTSEWAAAAPVDELIESLKHQYTKELSGWRPLRHGFPSAIASIKENKDSSLN